MSTPPDGRQDLIQLRRDTDDDWAAVDPILDDGEPGFDRDNLLLKIGDGITPWSLLTGISAGGGAPTGPAGGVLSGNYPNPGFDQDMATQAELDSWTDILAALSNVALKDGEAAGGVLAGTWPNPTFAVDMATQAELDALDAAAVKDGDAAGGVLSGTYPSPGFAADMATQAELDAAIATRAPATPTVAALAPTTGAVALDMAALDGTYQTHPLTGDVTYSTSNRAAGRTVTIKISAAALRTLTFPAWIFVGGGAPANIAAGKTGILTVTFFDGTDAAAVASYAAQP